MDKVEYREKLEEINRLVRKQDFESAEKLVDSIEWRRVRNVKTLCTVSEIYEASERYLDSKEILLLAYRRSHIGRSILYRLVMICAKLKEFDEAVDYYTEYVQAAPNDCNKYILKYIIYKGRGSSLDEQIQLLQEYKEKEYVEKWAYELAKLYDKAGLIDKCLDECDDLTLWFNEGKYVYKAMELKLKYSPLTPEQRAIYDRRFEIEEARAHENTLRRQKKAERAKKFQENKPEEEKDFIAKDFSVKVPVKEELFTDSLISAAEKEIAEAVSRVVPNEDNSFTKYNTQPVVHEDFDADLLQEKLASNMRALLASFSKVNHDNSDLDDPGKEIKAYKRAEYNAVEKEKDSISAKNPIEHKQIDQEVEILERQITGQMSINDILNFMGQQSNEVEEAKPEEQKEQEQKTEEFNIDEIKESRQVNIDIDFSQLEKAIESNIFDETNNLKNLDEERQLQADKSGIRTESFEEEIIRTLADFEKENRENRKGFKDPRQIMPDIAGLVDVNPIKFGNAEIKESNPNDMKESYEIESSIDDELLFVAIEKEKVALEEEKLRLEEEKDRISREKVALEETKIRERELLEQESRERAAFEEIKRKKEELELQAIRDRERSEREKKEAEERAALEELKRKNAELELMAIKERELAQLKEKATKEKEAREREAFEELKREKEELELRIIHERELAEEGKNKVRLELEEKLQYEIKERLLRELEEKNQRELGEKAKKDTEEQTDELGLKLDEQPEDVPDISLEVLAEDALEISMKEREETLEISSKERIEETLDVDEADSANEILSADNVEAVEIRLDDAISKALEKENAIKMSKKPEPRVDGLVSSELKEEDFADVPELLGAHDAKALASENQVEEDFTEVEGKFVEEEEVVPIHETEGILLEPDKNVLLEEKNKASIKIAEEPLYEPEDKISLDTASEALFKPADEIIFKAKSTIFSKDYKEDISENLDINIDLKLKKKEVRDALTEEELVRFSYFGPVQGLNSQLAEALSHAELRDLSDKTSRTGNIVVMGNHGMGKTVLATILLKIIFSSRGEESPKLEYMDATELNRKDVVSTIGKMEANALVIERAGLMDFEIVEKLSKAMEFNTSGLLVLLEGEKKPIRKLLEDHAGFSEKFPITIKIPVFTNDELVSFGKSYAKELDYKIDDMAILALYNEIGDSQSDVQPVSIAIVKEIVDRAIKKSERFGLKKFLKIILNKRYDKDDRIILYEKDFE